MSNIEVMEDRLAKIRDYVLTNKKHNKYRADVDRSSSSQGAYEEDERILAFIDSMQEESVCAYSTERYTDEDRKVLCEGCEEECKFNKKESASEDLEKAAINAADEDMQGRQIMEASNDERQRYSRIFRRGFKAGANWQKQQDNNDANHALVEQTKTQQMCYEKGMADMKQQMMANAVEGAFIRRNRYTKKNVLNGFDTTCDAIQGFKDKDKVKLIIIKDGQL